MNRGYQIVNESFKSNAYMLTAGGAAIGLHMLNKHIRTSRILKMYPTPQDLRNKLLNSDSERIRTIASELRDDMNAEQYKQWIDKNCNPNLGIGKAICLFLFGGVASVWQADKAAVHAGESGETLVNRAIRNGYVNN